MWNILLHKLNGNELVASNNNPKRSGRYVCTCVQYWNGEEINRYLQIMEFDAANNHWHDCGNKSGISHVILAWTDKIQLCEFDNFDYLIGGYLLEKDNST